MSFINSLSNSFKSLDKILQEGPRDSLSGTAPCLSTYHYGVHGEISQAFPLFLHTVSDQKLDVNFYITYPFGTCMNGWGCSSVSVRALQQQSAGEQAGNPMKMNVWHNDTTILLVQTLISMK